MTWKRRRPPDAGGSSRTPTDSWLPTEHGTDAGGLQRRVARGLAWSLIDNWGSQLLGLIVFVVLLRLLNADDIGLVALAAAFVAFAQLFVDQGLGDALVQRRVLTRGQIDTAFWTALATGSLLTIAGVVVAHPIAAIVGEPRLAPILQVLALAPLLTAFSSIQMALLHREMAFRNLAIRRLVALVGGGAIGIALALLGFGPWALVAQQLGQAIISVLTLWTVSPWRPGFSVSWADFRTLFSFGVNIVAGDVLFYLSRNVDALLIGTFLGPTALGFYAVGFRFLDTSTTMLVQAARKLVFPTFSRLQHDRGRLRRAYARMNRLTSAVTLPGYLGLALIAPEAIVVFVGERWADSASVAMVLVLIGPVLTVQAFSGGLFNAVGHPEVTLRFRLLATVTNVTGFLIAVLVFNNIVAVAAAYVVRGYILLPVVLWWMRVYVEIPIRDNLLRLRNIAAATAAMAAAVLVLKVVLLGSASAASILLSSVVVGAIVYCLTLAILDRGLVTEVWQFAVQTITGGEHSSEAGTSSAGSRRPIREVPSAADEQEIV